MNDNLKYVIEALLFSKGEAVSVEDIAGAIMVDNEAVISLINELNDEYESENRGFRIIKVEDSYRMCSNPNYYEYLRRLALAPKRKKLTGALLETLAIIAYKQPITRLEIDKIRGVKSDYMLNQLLEYGVIEEIGRLDVVGRPILFGTTEEFLLSFGLNSVDELPKIDDERVIRISNELRQELNFNEELELDTISQNNI